MMVGPVVRRRREHPVADSLRERAVRAATPAAVAPAGKVAWGGPLAAPRATAELALAAPAVVQSAVAVLAGQATAVVASRALALREPEPVAAVVGSAAVAPAGQATALVVESPAVALRAPALAVAALAAVAVAVRLVPEVARRAAATEASMPTSSVIHHSARTTVVDYTQMPSRARPPPVTRSKITFVSRVS